ncbi:MAG: hypothetical protein RR256_00535 [Bacteroidales bacterium]
MKNYKILPPLYFLVLALLSLFFANTIASTGQNSYDIFILLNPTSGLDTSVFSTNYFNSIVCKLAMDWGASMQVIAYLWVLLNVLFVYICYLLVSKVFKQELLGFSILLLSCGMSVIFIQQAAILYRALLCGIVGIAMVVYFLNRKSGYGIRRLAPYIYRVSKPMKGVYALWFLLIWTVVLRYLPSVSPNLYNVDIANWGTDMYVNGFSYLLKNMITTYFFVFVIMGYLGVLYICKKEYIRLAFLILAPLWFVIFSLPKQGGLYYESCFLIFIAVLVFWFLREVVWAKKASPFWFYVIAALLLASFSNFIKTALKCQERETYFSVIEKAIENTYSHSNLATLALDSNGVSSKSTYMEQAKNRKIDGRNCELNMERLQSSAIPHLEFLLYNALSKGMPCLFIFPETRCSRVQSLWTHTKGNIKDTSYIKAPKNLIPYYLVLYTDCGAETLFSEKGNVSFLKSETHPYSQFFQAYTQSSDTAYEGKYSVKIFDKQMYGMEITIAVKPFDKIKISTKRLGNNNGFIVLADTKDKGRGMLLYKSVNNPDPSSIRDSSAWETLSIETIIPPKVNYVVIYTFNNTEEICYFDNLQISILRQCTPLEAQKAKKLYLKPKS